MTLFTETGLSKEKQKMIVDAIQQGFTVKSEVGCTKIYKTTKHKTPRLIRAAFACLLMAPATAWMFGSITLLQCARPSKCGTSSDSKR